MSLSNILNRFYNMFQFKREDGEIKVQKRNNSLLDDTPDKPVSFGYKTSWLAVKDTNINKIVNDLNIKVIGKANWESGLSAAYNGGAVFITPPINEWTFVVGLYFDNGKDFVSTIAKSIPDFYYFFTERVSETHAWVSVKNKAIIRAFGYSGGNGEILFDYGSPTGEEMSLGLTFEKLRNNEWDDDTRIPNEDDVLAISAAWTINTLEIDNMDEKESIGIVGIFDHN